MKVLRTLELRKLNKWAIFKGAKRVIALDCVDYRLNHAKSYKGVETVNLEDYDDTK